MSIKNTEFKESKSSEKNSQTDKTIFSIGANHLKGCFPKIIKSSLEIAKQSIDLESANAVAFKEINDELDTNGLFRKGVLNDEVKLDDYLDSNSRIVDVSITDNAIDEICNQVEKLMRLQLRVNSYNEYTDTSAYVDFAFNFYYGALFLKNFPKFFKDNFSTYDNALPNFDAVGGEFFYHKRGFTGLHCGSTTSVNAVPQVKYMDSMNMHYTLTDYETIESSPFIIWEDCESLITTARFMYNYLWNANYITAENKDLFLKAVTLACSKARTEQGTGARFLYLNYWKVKYQEKEIDGVIHLYSKKKALMFSPDLPHAGELNDLINQKINFTKRISVASKLIRFNDERINRDMEKGYINSMDGIHQIDKRRDEFGEVIFEFYSKLMGYDSKKEMINLLYGGYEPKTKSAALVSFKGEKGYISIENLEKHFERTAEFHEKVKLNPNAKQFLIDYYKKKYKHKI